jgi:hypothetical protein
MEPRGGRQNVATSAVAAAVPVWDEAPATAVDHKTGLSQPMAALAVEGRPPPGLPEAADVAVESSGTEVSGRSGWRPVRQGVAPLAGASGRLTVGCASDNHRELFGEVVVTVLKGSLTAGIGWGASSD